MGLDQAVPGIGLGLLQPGGEVFREQGVGAVVAGGGALFVKPAMGGQVGADAVLEGEFLVDRHAASVLLVAASWRASQSL